jgi:membrane associated rhomboid family serine protease/DNA-directed RNA polymerase subunit RPC12/RpoP
MISMILVFFNFLIFFVMFFGIQSKIVTTTEIYTNFAFSSNYLIGQKSYIAAFSIDKIFTIVTHMFIHAGVWHIAGNMIFLIFLGMPFEEKVGSWAFLAIYLITGVFASVFTAFFALVSGGALGQDPMGIGVGASGAIFGILGAFLATYPGEKIMFPLLIIRKWPVWLIAAIYFGFETMIAASSPEDHIGHYAHIGGFIGGLMFIPYVKKLKTEEGAVQTLDHLDFDQLEKFATNYKLKDMLEKIRNEDQREIQEAWLDEFLKKIRCPECGKKLAVKPHQAKCMTKGCGFKIKY